MTNYLPSRYDRTIIRSFARTVRDACKTFNKCPYDFTDKATKTDLFISFYDNYTLHSQSPNCIANEFIKEISGKILTEDEFLKQYNIPINKSQKEIDSISGYWMGFLLMQWLIKDKNAINLIRQCNMESVYWAYDMLHTQDINYAIDFIKKEYIKN